MLVVTNLDEDHVRDFESTLKHVSIGTVSLNNTIDASRLKLMKKDGMGRGVQSIHDYLQQPAHLNLPFGLPQIKVSLFRFPFGAFTDTNNLSLITFVEYGQFCILYPGDLEEAGWRQALLNAAFRALLQRVSVCVPSHHGRESGCCAAAFGYAACNPWAFVISDKEMMHDTQETTGWYRQHAKGVQKILKNPWDIPDTRYVFTTRNDGCVSIQAEANGNFVLYPNSTAQKNVEPQQPAASAPPSARSGIFG